MQSASRAAELMPDLAEAHLIRGVSLAAQQQFGAAESACRKALTLRPDDARTLNELGGALTGLNRFDEALVYLGKPAELTPSDALIQYRISVAQYHAGDAYASEAACRLAVSLDPNFARAWSVLAQILELLGRFDEARSCARHALELDPEMAVAYIGLGIIGEHAGDEAGIRPLADTSE